MSKNKQFIRQKGDQGGYRGSAQDQDGNMGDDETLVDIVEVKEHAQDLFESNQTLILAVITGLILLLGGYLGYKYAYQIPREEAGLEAIYKAENQFRRDSFALALDNPGAGFEGFLDIIDNYSGTKASNLAKYYAGVSYLNLGKYDVAIDYLKEYNAHDDVTPITKYGAIGDAYAELGDMDQAASFYNKATGHDNEFLTPYYLNKLALLSMNSGDNSAAHAIYEKIANDYPESVEAKDAKKFVVKLK